MALQPDFMLVHLTFVVISPVVVVHRKDCVESFLGV